MKILLAANNLCSIGGSEMYHFELSKCLKQLGHTVYLLSYNSFIHDSYFTSKIMDNCDNLYFIHTLPNDLKIDVMQLSQPQPTQYCLKNFSHVPAISVIHSEIRSEDPIVDSRIKHYVGIRPSICEMLVNDYKLDKNKVQLIYNPIDQTRFSKNIVSQDRYRYYGVFVGEVLDNIRLKAACDFAETCIKEHMECWFVSKSRFHKYDSNIIKFIDPVFHTEDIIKHATFTGGIQWGRTAWESLSMGINHINYIIDVQGNIKQKETLKIGDFNVDLCNKMYVTSQLLQLYTSVI